MSIRSVLGRTIIPAVVLGGSITATAVYSPWIDTKFLGIDIFSRALLWLDPETAHNWAIWAGEKKLMPYDGREDSIALKTELWGREYRNPIGLAAGFDKDAKVMEAMIDMGFGFVEIGSVTPLEQKGNPLPRVFRITEHKAVINRYGFNSAGVDVVAARLATFRSEHPEARIGVNLGVNKSNALDWRSAARDYVTGVKKLGQFGDYVVINVSSPNTLGLRALQTQQQFASMVSQVKRAMDELKWDERGRPPLFVKISPDLTEQDKQDIAKVALNRGFDGLIVSNTTISRKGVGNSPLATEVGGMSGAPLFDASTQLLSEMYIMTKGVIPIIGCGGISNGAQAYEKIKAGASLVEIYTGMIYEGPSVIPTIKKELTEQLKRDGYESVSQAVGADHRSVQGQK